MSSKGLLRVGIKWLPTAFTRGTRSPSWNRGFEDGGTRDSRLLKKIPDIENIKGSLTQDF